MSQARCINKFTMCVTAMEPEIATTSIGDVPFYNSTLEEESDGEVNLPPSKTSCTEHVYVADEVEFNSIAEAVDAVVGAVFGSTR